MFDPGTRFVEGFREEGGLVLGVRPVGDHRTNAAFTGGLPVGLGVIALVGDGGAGSDIGSDIEQGLELTAVADLAAGQVEVERVAFEVRFEMDFRRESAA